jgi:hypothetical protein
MSQQTHDTATPAPAPEKPAYEPPRIQLMTEREILATFQITQSMNGWWVSGMC